jgi:hypothetical protein
LGSFPRIVRGSRFGGGFGLLGGIFGFEVATALDLGVCFVRGALPHPPVGHEALVALFDGWIGVAEGVEASGLEQVDFGFVDAAHVPAAGEDVFEEHPFGFGARLDVFDDGVAEGFEEAVLAGGDDEVFGGEAVFAGVHRGDCFTGFGARSGGKLGVDLVRDADGGRDELLVTAFFRHCGNSFRSNTVHLSTLMYFE